MKIWIVMPWILGWALMSQTLNADEVKNLHLPHFPGELIVGFEPGTDSGFASLVGRYGGRIQERFASIDAALVVFDQKFDRTVETLAKLGQSLLSEPGIRYVEANSVLRAVDMNPTSVNDPQFGEQYGLNNTGQSGGIAGFDIAAPVAWQTTQGNKSVLVAVVDTGIDHQHPDLKNNIWTNPGESGLDVHGKDRKSNGLDDDQNGYVDDYRGWDFVANDNDPMDDNGHSHGTHCAGVIGAESNNLTGIAGINWKVSLVGVKFLDAGGSGSLANAIKAVEYGTKIGARVSSNSWGGGGYSEALEAIIADADRNGVLFIAAAGNDGVDTDDSPHYPSSYANPNLISVAAIDRSGKLADFSNYGRLSVDLAAPGVDIVSTIRSGKYEKLSGTSMATPHVSGVAALIWSAHPTLDHYAVKSRILNSSLPTESVQGKTMTHGRLNAGAAVEIDEVAPGNVRDISITGAERLAITARWHAAGDDGELGNAHAYEVRWTERPVTTEAEWSTARQLEVESIARLAGNNNEMIVRIIGFGFNDRGFLAVRARDNVGNLGPISDGVEFGVETVQIAGHFQPENISELQHNGTWGVELLNDRRGLVFSDSPDGNYSANQDSSILLPVMKIETAGYAVAFEAKADLERGYDFGRIEIQINGQGEWKLIKRVTDHYDWRSYNLELDSFLSGATSFQLRFRLTSDAEFEHGGWWINDINIIHNE
jgi:subtilisin family serine protease